MKRKLLIVAGLGLSLLGVAGCTTAQTQAELDAFKSVCNAVIPTGGQLLVDVSNTIGVPGYSAVIGAGTILASSLCDVAEQGVEQAINAITQAGGAANVTVTQSGGNSASFKRAATKLAKKFGVKAKVTATDGKVVIQFTVPPQSSALPF